MELPSFAFAANRDPLDHHTMEAVACGVPTRKYGRSLDSLPEETLTLQGLGLEGTLYRKLRTTNAIENLNSGVAAYSKNVKRWQGGRWWFAG